MNPDPATPLGQALAAIIATLVAALAEYARENPAFAAPIGIAIRRLNTIAQEFDALAAAWQNGTLTPSRRPRATRRRRPTLPQPRRTAPSPRAPKPMQSRNRATPPRAPPSASTRLAPTPTPPEPTPAGSQTRWRRHGPVEHSTHCS